VVGSDIDQVVKDILQSGLTTVFLPIIYIFLMYALPLSWW